MNLFLITIGLILVGIILFSIYRRTKVGKSYSLLTEEESFRVSYVDNPILKLTFKESLDLNKLNNDLIHFNMNKSEEALKQVFNISPGDGIKMLESVKVVKESNNIVWELSKEGRKLLKAGKVEWAIEKETGKLLPTLREVKGKKITELIKGKKAGNLANAAKLTNVIVNAAHIISGADLAKKLNQVNNKLDYLIAARKIDKYSGLESCYYELQELLYDPYCINTRENILQIHKQIRRIRITLRNELEYHFNNIKDPMSLSFFYFKMFFGLHENINKEIYEAVSKFEDEMRLIDYCFALDFAICGLINQDMRPLKNEIERFRDTSAILKSKRIYLMGWHSKYNIDNHINYLSDISNKYTNYIQPDFLAE